MTESPRSCYWYCASCHQLWIICHMAMPSVTLTLVPYCSSLWSWLSFHLHFILLPKYFNPLTLLPFLTSSNPFSSFPGPPSTPLFLLLVTSFSSPSPPHYLLPLSSYPSPLFLSLLLIPHSSSFLLLLISHPHTPSFHIFSHPPFSSHLLSFLFSLPIIFLPSIFLPSHLSFYLPPLDELFFISLYILTESSVVQYLALSSSRTAVVVSLWWPASS